MIGIIGAMEMEIQRIRDLMEIAEEIKVSSTVFYVGKLADKELVLACCGVGKVNAAVCTQSMLLRFCPRVILNPGVAGGIGDGVRIGDVVVGNSCVQHDMDTTALGDPPGTLFTPVGEVLNLPCNEAIGDLIAQVSEKIYDGTVHRGVIATGDQFVADKEKCLRLQEEFGAIACEMESGAIAQVCYLSDVPFVALRTISDNANQSGKVDFITFAKYSAEKAADLVSALLPRL